LREPVLGLIDLGMQAGDLAFELGQHHGQIGLHLARRTALGQVQLIDRLLHPFHLLGQGLHVRLGLLVLRAQDLIGSATA
jgi:hypothetical protein